jgi:hypothetical protein
VASPTADLVFHAETASEVWFPATSLFTSDDGTVVSPIGLGQGAIYTVESQVIAPTASQMRQATASAATTAADTTAITATATATATTTPGATLQAALQRRYTQLPHPYPQVEALARSITAGSASTYDEVQALIAWMGAHTRYSTEIPSLPAGADTVDEFLFGDRVGFCEQISTSLAVMLRTLGIPVREAVGYVPGPYNPITDLYDVRADDAHAWVQVWIPGYGWQSFDPTASVPLANPAPGATALKDVAHALTRLPLVPLAVALGGVGGGVAVLRARRSRPATWAERVTRHVERAGRRAGRPRRLSETFAEYAAVVGHLSRDGPQQCERLAGAVDASAYGGRDPGPEAQRQLVATARRIPVNRRRLGVGTTRHRRLFTFSS